MSKLIVDQKTIGELFSDKKADFLIPDYQRPYAWEENECQTLWDDIFSFAFPNNNRDEFDSENDEYFLGPIVTFKNENNKQEIIDGQQRLTTLMLLLRAFYSFFGNMQDENSIRTGETIGKCIWKTDEFGNPDTNKLKLESDVLTDDKKEELLNILKTGIVNPNQKSRYAKNYQFFMEKIDEFLRKFPGYFPYLPNRIMKNCILLPIEAESQDTALRIFSTLNDRGKPLSDTDIFKAQLYKIYTIKNEKDLFVERWKNLESVCNDIFKNSTGSAMDELFAMYMYYKRAQLGIKASTTEGLRKFYERDNYIIFKDDLILDNLEALSSFWQDVFNQNEERFSEKILKKLFVLNYGPNSMWRYFVSVYFMNYKDEENKLEENSFYEFLDLTIAFIFAYAIYNPGVNALRTPVYAEMINIVNNKKVTFENFKFNSSSFRKSFENFQFYNQRPITRSILTWYAFLDNEQPLLKLSDEYQIEHIFAKNRQDIENSLSNSKNIEKLGNKSLLETRINIRASDYKFTDKKRYYTGYTNSRGIVKEGTKIKELSRLVDNTSFNEKDIEERNTKIINSFIELLISKNLID